MQASFGQVLAGLALHPDTCLAVGAGEAVSHVLLGGCEPVPALVVPSSWEGWRDTLGLLQMHLNLAVSER